MPDISSVFKQEISRIARKELRSESGSSKKAIASHRHQISELRRQLQALEREVAKLRKLNGGRSVLAPSEQEDSPNLRFRADGFAKHRQRLGLSAREMGLLVGASGLSVYKWEQGKAKPRAHHLQAIAAVRKLGKREASQRLEELASGE